MRKALTKSRDLYHINDGNKVDGTNPLMRGYCTGLSGNCSGLRGDCTGLSGDCTGLRGDCTGLRGDCSGLRGDLDDCDLTADERAAGFSVADLVGP